MISYQLYSSRKFGPAADTIRRMADLGYRAVEGYGALLDDADARASVAQALKDTGLAMPTVHVGLSTLEDDPEIASLLTDMKVERVYVPFVPPADRPTDAEGWRAFGDRIARAGASLSAQGIRVGWHNHDFEFRPLPDGSIPMEHLLAADIDWQFDVAWCVRADADPMDWIVRHGSRITAAHVKDIAPKGEKTDEDGWADPGTGTMDWSALSDALAKSGTVGFWVMEHDNPSDDARFATAALSLAKAEGMS